MRGDTLQNKILVHPLWHFLFAVWSYNGFSVFLVFFFTFDMFGLRAPRAYRQRGRTTGDVLKVLSKHMAPFMLTCLGTKRRPAWLLTIGLTFAFHRKLTCMPEEEKEEDSSTMIMYTACIHWHCPTKYCFVSCTLILLQKITRICITNSF